MYKAGLMTVSIVALSACASTQPFDSAAPRQVPMADSMVTVWPGAGTGAIRSVVQTQYVNAIEQKVSINTGSKGPGENYIKVVYFKTAAEKLVQGGLQDVPLAKQDMGGEARGTVNWADMKVSPYYVQNVYGPFGYAMGRTATSDICMYAWQRIPPPRFSKTSEWKAVNVRMLICDHGKTEQQLLEAMMQLHLKGVGGAIRPAPEDIGAYGMVLSPYDKGPANVLAPIPAAPAATPRAPKAPPPVIDSPGPVPSPPGSGGGAAVPGPGGSPTPIVRSPN